MSEWTNESMLLFMELYQSEPVLWEPTNIGHKDRKKINDAWDRLSSGMGRPIKELKKKKDSLMATFRSHLRKKKAAIQSGVGVDELYKPIWFAYELMESFLAPVFECNETMDSAQNQTLQEEFVDDPGEPEIPPTSESTAHLQSTSSASRVLQTTRRHPIDVPSSATRRRANPPELQEAGKQLKNAFSTLDNLVAKRAHEKEDDEYDLYGKMIAKKLRKIPEHERETLMYNIDGIFMRRNRYPASPSTFPVMSTGDINQVYPTYANTSNEVQNQSSSLSTPSSLCDLSHFRPSYSPYPGQYLYPQSYSPAPTTPNALNENNCK